MSPSLESSRRDLLKAAADPVEKLVAQFECVPTGAAPTPSLAWHAANRLMYGGAPGDVARIESIGYDAFLAEQLAPAGINDAACDTLLNALARDTLTATPAQLYDRRQLADFNEAQKPMVQVRHNIETRRRNTKRQLEERLVEFWYDHFSIFGSDFIVRSMFPLWNTTMRANTRGNFRTFLEATAVNPCMLWYLDNYANTNGGPNENYARELFELHALGDLNYQVGGGYIDDDVYESSRCFTGWTFELGSTVATRGQFLYNATQHDRFQKVVLGTRIPNDQPAMADGRKVLDLIRDFPGASYFLALKLCRRFVSDTPSLSLVQSVADVLYANRTDGAQLAKGVGFLLRTDEFKNTRGNKFKRPLDWVMSAMRALVIAYWTHDSFRWMFDPLGQPTFGWRPPDGPPDTAEYWQTSANMLGRWNMMLQIASGWFTSNGAVLPITGLMPVDRTTPRQVAMWWADRVIGRPLSGATEFALIEFVAEGRSWDKPMPATQITSKQPILAALCTTTPEFMYR